MNQAGVLSSRIKNISIIPSGVAQFAKQLETPETTNATKSREDPTHVLLCWRSEEQLYFNSLAQLYQNEPIKTIENPGPKSPNNREIWKPVCGPSEFLWSCFIDLSLCRILAWGWTMRWMLAACGAAVCSGWTWTTSSWETKDNELIKCSMLFLLCFFFIICLCLHRTMLCMRCYVSYFLHLCLTNVAAICAAAQLIFLFGRTRLAA